jgi:putative membrane protein
VPVVALVPLAALGSVFGIVHGVFGTPIRGRIALFYTVSVVYVFAMASLGLAIAMVARNLGQAMLLLLLILYPMLLLSGAFTPPETMGPLMRYARAAYHEDVKVRRPALPALLLAWYVLFAAWSGISPADPDAWMLASALPTTFVLALAASYRRFPLSHASYLQIAVFLTLHTVGVHYTYARVPLGDWVGRALALGRNHFDRLVHFAFGLLIAYPVLEAFGRLVTGSRLLLYYVVLVTSAGLSGLWEILEAAVAQVVRPELGAAYLGAQGDLWDAQHDMAAAVGGTALAVLLTWVLGGLRDDRAAKVIEALPEASEH